MKKYDNKLINSISVSGIVKKIIYKNDINNYSIVSLKTNDNKTYTITGKNFGVSEGESININGTLETHLLYGEQIKMINYQFLLSSNNNEIEKYLSSGIIFGIGPKRAKIIVNHFKENTFKILDEDINNLKKIPKFSSKIIHKIKKSWEKNSYNRNIMMFLQTIGLTVLFSKKIYNFFEKNSLKEVKKNPFIMINKINGMTFKKIDNIARNLNIKPNDKNRISALIIHILNQTINEGHTCYPKDKFLKYYNLNEYQITMKEFENILSLNIQENKIIIDNIFISPSFNIKQNVIYDKLLYIYEKKIVKTILKIFYHKQENKKIINIKKSNYHISLNKEQINAINNIFINNISIITGGPGVGKTTIIKETIEQTKNQNLKVILSAPTGRAAKRLNEITTFNTSTIHKVLKWNEKYNTFTYNENNKLECDIIIIDEVSMIDLKLFYHMLMAIKESTSIVLIGDINQLPSIGPGNVLRDLIFSKIFPTTKLIYIYRQERYSKIIDNAYLINNGFLIKQFINNTNALLTSPKSDFYWIKTDEKNNDTTVFNIIFDLINRILPKKFEFTSSKDIQILSPMLKGKCGVISLNQEAQSCFNKNKQCINIFNKKFKLNDKVIQLINNYKKNVFNGDIGFIENINKDTETISIKFDQNIILYKFSELKEIDLAYAMTIHKSQGSEFNVVIVPCINSHYIMLQRNLLYTAITRAKKLLIIIGPKNALITTINNYKTKLRYSGFLYRLITENNK